MLGERGPVARLEGDHRHRHGIALVFEEERAGRPLRHRVIGRPAARIWQA